MCHNNNGNLQYQQKQDDYLLTMKLLERLRVLKFFSFLYCSLMVITNYRKDQNSVLFHFIDPGRLFIAGWVAG